MGDAEDAWVEVEDNEVPVNQNPEVLTKNYDLVTGFLSTYGWIVLISAAVLYYLWKNRIQPAMSKLHASSQLSAHKKYDSSEIERRQMAMDAHRKRLQDEHDRKAAEHAVKQAELEERKRQEKLEDWDRHQAGLGYRSKVKKAETEQPATVIPKNKKRLRDADYNPLMGGETSGGDSSGWRPARRGPAAGGG